MTSVFVSGRADFHVTSSHRFQFVVSRKWRVSDTKKQPWFFLVVCNKNQAAEGCFWVLFLHLLSNSPEASCCDWTCVSWQYKMTQQTYISSNIHTWTTLFNWPFLFEHMWLCMHSQCCSTVETFLLCHVELLYVSNYSLVYFTALAKSWDWVWLFIGVHCPLEVRLICHTKT